MQDENLGEATYENSTSMLSLGADVDSAIVTEMCKLKRSDDLGA